MGVAAARLAQIISLNGGATIRPIVTAVTPIDLVTTESVPQESLATALANRPELKESRDLVAIACERLSREKYVPLVPSVLLGAPYGGVGNTVADFNDRTDFDAVSVWQAFPRFVVIKLSLPNEHLDLWIRFSTAGQSAKPARKSSVGVLLPRLSQVMTPDDDSSQNT